MTDNKLWSTIINPNADVELTESTNGLYRGIKISFTPSKELIPNIETTTIIVEKNEFTEVSINYKEARKDIIKEVRKLIKNNN